MTHWQRYDRHWRLLAPPLRPDAAVIACMRKLIAARPGPGLLLGSTPEYAALGPHLAAVDMSFPMLRTLWAAPHPGQPAVQGDWARLPLRDGCIDHVLGDGSLQAVPFDAVLPRVLREVTRVLQPGGLLAARTFCRPQRTETLDQVRADALAGRIGNFHAFKWRVAMACVAHHDIAVQEIRNAVDRMFPDRGQLCHATGWPRAEVDTIDIYAGPDSVYNLPTVSQLTARLGEFFDDVEVLACGSYPLAQRCPVFVARRPRPPHGPGTQG